MAGAPPSSSNFPAIVELNVGGVFYSTSISTLTSEPGSKLAKTFGSEASPETVLKDSKVSMFKCVPNGLVHPVFNSLFWEVQSL